MNGQSTMSHNNGGDCKSVYVGLALTALALLISLSLNIFLYILRRQQNRDALQQRDSFHCYWFEEDEQINHDNPIYGNIHLDGKGSLMTNHYNSSECMTEESVTRDNKGESTDINYASLDLRAVKKLKKKRKYRDKPSQAHQFQTHPSSTTQQRCVETRADCEVTLPSRSSSLMVSRNSIYLNSHQVALEAKELEREREKERKNNRGREMENMNLHGTFDHNLGQSEPSHEPEG